MTKKKNNDKKTEKEKKSKVTEIKTETVETDYKQKFIEQQDENAKLKDKLLRSAAEFENFRKRNAQEKVNWIRNATERLVLELCDVADNFERAIGTGAKEHEFESFMEGVKLIYKQLADVLEKEGVKRIDALNSDFDPMFHEALAQIPSDLEENKIAAVIKNGYTMNNKVIRAAQVAVSNGQNLTQEDKNKEE